MGDQQAVAGVEARALRVEITFAGLESTHQGRDIDIACERDVVRKPLPYPGRQLPISDGADVLGNQAVSDLMRSEVGERARRRNRPQRGNDTVGIDIRATNEHVSGERTE